MTKAEIRKLFHTRKGTKLDKVVAYIVPREGEAINLERLAEKVHAKNSTAVNPINAVRMSILGLNRKIVDFNLPYKPVIYGRKGGKVIVILERAKT